MLLYFFIGFGNVSVQFQGVPNYARMCTPFFVKCKSCLYIIMFQYLEVTLNIHNDYVFTLCMKRDLFLLLRVETRRLTQESLCAELYCDHPRSMNNQHFMLQYTGLDFQSLQAIQWLKYETAAMHKKSNNKSICQS